MNPPSNSQVVDLSRTLGQDLVSIFFSTALFGMMCVQAVKYFTTYKSDTWQLKSLIIVILVLEAFHEVVCIRGLWEYMIPKFGDIANMSATHTFFSLEPLVTGIVTALAQSFFTWRIWRFSNKNKLLPIILVPLIIITLVFYLIIFEKTLSAPPLKLPLTRNIVLRTGSAIAATDVLIATTMCILLWSGRTGLIESDKIIVRLMNASMTTGASTAIFALISIVTGAIWPHDYFYVLGEMPLCAMYCNAVLANLNSRRYIGGADVINISMDTKPPRSSLKFGTLDASGPQQHDGMEDITMEQARYEEHRAQAISAQY